MSNLTAALLSLAALGASNADGFGCRTAVDVPVGWRPGEKRGPAPDLREEIQRYFRGEWKHRITGQHRIVFRCITDEGKVLMCQCGNRAHAKWVPLRKALAWLRNAEEVKS